MKRVEVKSSSWSVLYLGLWIVWTLVAFGYAFVGGQAVREHWWVLAVVFGILELIGGLAYQDRLPMLTQVFGRYVPMEVLFPVLAVVAWKLSNWVYEPIVWGGCAWQTAHFLRHYHSYQKFHSSTP